MAAAAAEWSWNWPAPPGTCSGTDRPGDSSPVYKSRSRIRICMPIKTVSSLTLLRREKLRKAANAGKL